ncbi:MAG: TerB family tellurite resistance protein [Bacteroidales bacterium]
MANFLKWLGGGIGWAAGGPIGAILGFALGSMIDGMQSGKYEYEPHSQPNFNTPQTTPNDFIVSLLILSSAVMKSDQKVLKSELDYVKQFLLRQFGASEAERQLLMLREFLKKDYDLNDVGNQIKLYMEYPSRLQLMHFLFGLASADSQVHPSELQMISQLSEILGIKNSDFESIKAMFVKDTTSIYRILEVTPDASDEELKKAYRRMALKYHPDRVAHLGEDVQKAANSKFQELNAAYEQVKKQRGIV